MPMIKGPIMVMPEGEALFWVESCSQETQASIFTAEIATQCALRLFTSAGSQTDADLPDTNVNKVNPRASWDVCSQLGSEDSVGSTAGTLRELRGHQNCSCDPDGGGIRQFGDSHDLRALNRGKCYACQSNEQFIVQQRNCSIPEQVLGRKEDVCGVCERRFRDNASLLIHIRTHTGEKPFACQFCPKRYAIQYSLVRHERCHTGKNLFVCGACQKEFVTKWALDVHRRSHTGEKPYACQFCSKRYARRDYAVSHERSHAAEKPFACSICQKRFTRKQYLIYHELTQHPLPNS